MGKVCVFLGEGFEEVEALTVVDLLRRAKIEVETVSVMEQAQVVSSHGIPVTADTMLADVDFDTVDMLVLPGGMAGTRNLEACQPLMDQVDAFAAAGKAVCAICAAPSILGHRGLLKGKKAIAYPGFEPQLTGAQIVYEPAVRDGNIITGRGMGCSIDFALALITCLKDAQTADTIAAQVVYSK